MGVKESGGESTTERGNDMGVKERGEREISDYMT